MKLNRNSKITVLTAIEIILLAALFGVIYTMSNYVILHSNAELAGLVVSAILIILTIYNIPYHIWMMLPSREIITGTNKV